MGNRLRVGLLGPLTVHAGDRRVDLGGRQPRVLLAALALAAPRPLTLESVAESLWDGPQPTRVRNAVQMVVSRLRRELGAGSVETVTDGYRLSVAAGAVDAHQFRKLVRQAGSAPDGEVLSLLADAVALWRGEPLEDVPSDRLRTAHGPRLWEEWFTATLLRIDVLLRQGRHADLVPELRDLTQRHPQREPLWQRLMTALYRSGRQADALRAYQELRVRLRDHLGVDPDPELQALHLAILNRDPALDPPGAVPDPLGSSALAPSGTPAPDPGTPPPVPRQLPADVGRFTGRAGDLARLDKLLPDWERGASSPVVIAAVGGTGGVGKTALAVHWAHRVVDRFPDGQLHLNLRGYGPGEPTDPAAAAESLLRAIGVADVPADLDSRSALLRSTLAGRRTLILLDNARDAEQVRPLLPGRDALVLVTSRSQLRSLAVREGAHRISLGQLPADESARYLVTALGPGAASQPDAVAALADRCGHLPLALAIVAEQAIRRPEQLSDLAAELAHEPGRLDVLNAGGDAAGDLRAVFDWSYRALEPELARAFRLLALHPVNDLSVPAAAALLGTPVRKTQRLLRRLIDANLLQQRSSGRYEYHDLLRAYALEHAYRDPDRDQVVERVLAWYVEVAGWADQLVRPGRTRRYESGETPPRPELFDTRDGALGWYDAERGALLAGVGLAAAQGLHGTAWRLAHRVWHYLYMRQAMDEWRTTHEVGLMSARQVGDRYGEACMLTGLGNVHADVHRFPEAVAHYQQALHHYDQLGDRGAAGRLYGNLGIIQHQLQQYDDAMRSLRRSLEIAREIGETYDEASTLINLADMLVDTGNHHEAVEVAGHAVTAARQIEDEVGVAWALKVLGKARTAAGGHEPAMACLREAGTMFQQLGNRNQEAWVYVEMASAQHGSGRPAAARDALLRALEIFTELEVAEADDVRRRLAELESR
ncbi:MAG: AfsR/SARP family transcriptional regulator [Micromonosporaceae bacterium]